MAFDPAKLKAVADAEQGSGFDPAKLKAVADAAKKSGQGGQVTITDTPQTGMPSAGDFDFATSAKQTGSHIYDNYIQPAIIPLAASVAATRLPGLAVTSIPTAIGSTALEGAYQGTAGYLADKANQALDISPPGEDQAIAQGGIQGLAAMGQKAYRILSPFRGRPGAVRANDLAETEAQRTVQKYKPTAEPETLFAEAAKEKATVPLNETMSYVNGRIQAMLQHDPTANMQNLGSKLKQNFGPAGETMYKLWKLAQDKGSIASDTWQFQHSQLGKTIGSMKPNAVGYGEASQVYGRMLTDLERVAERETGAQNTGVVQGGTYDFTPQRPATGGAITDTQTPAIQPMGGSVGTPEAPLRSTPLAAPAPQGLGATKLLQALQTYRRQQSVDRISNIVEKAMTLSRGQGGDESFNAAGAIRALKKDRFFPKAFTPAEQKDIVDTLHILNTAPSLPPPTSLVTGSSNVADRGIKAAIGGSLAGPAGAVAGYALKDVGTLAGNIGFALTTKAGREMVKELSKSKGGLTNKRSMAVLASYVTAMKNQPTEGTDNGE